MSEPSRKIQHLSTHVYDPETCTCDHDSEAVMCHDCYQQMNDYRCHLCADPILLDSANAGRIITIKKLDNLKFQICANCVVGFDNEGLDQDDEDRENLGDEAPVLDIPTPGFVASLVSSTSGHLKQAAERLQLIQESLLLLQNAKLPKGSKKLYDMKSSPSIDFKSIQTLADQLENLSDQLEKVEKNVIDSEDEEEDEEQNDQDSETSQKNKRKLQEGAGEENTSKRQKN
jgi:hypothetical protein